MLELSHVRTETGKLDPHWPPEGGVSNFETCCAAHHQTEDNLNNKQTTWSAVLLLSSWTWME